jgi:hypothetical protein
MSVPYKNVEFNSTLGGVKFFKGKLVEIHGRREN